MASSPTELRLQDIDSLEIDARRALTRDRPASDALWAALLKGRNTILRRYRDALDQMSPQDADALQRANTQLLDPRGAPMVGPLGRLLDQTDGGPPALISVAEACVAKAILGDGAMAEAIFNRIEGRVGVRKEDVDADQVNRRGEMIMAIEETVKRLQEQPGDTAVDVTPKPKKNGAGVTDVEIENIVRRFSDEDETKSKPNGKTPKKPPGGSGFTS